MKIEKTQLEDHQIQLNVRVEPETFDPVKRRAARKISKNKRIPGFRPGKAPYPVIVRQFGEAVVLEEALELLVEEIYPKLLDDSEVTPYGPGQLKNVLSLDPPELEFVIPLAPEVELGDYTEIRQDYELPEVTEDDIDQTIENLRARQARTELVDRPAEVGDMLSISLTAVDTAAAEDAEPLLTINRTPAVIEAEDADTETEWPFPGFSNGLKGLSAGEEASFTHEYAEDYEQDDTLAGKSVQFNVTVHEVRSRELPELTDEFVQSLGEYESVEDLREDARKHLESSTKSSYDSGYESQLLDEVVAASVFRFPPQMVEDEIDTLVEEFKNRLANEGWEFDTYLKANQQEESELREEFQETAERRIRRGLAVLEIANKEEIKVSERDVQQEVQQTVDMVSSSFPERERRNILTEDVLRGLVSRAMRDKLTERTFARLKAIATGEAEKSEETEASETEESDVEPASEESEPEIAPEAEADAAPEAELEEEPGSPEGDQDPESETDEETDAA